MVYYDDIAEELESLVGLSAGHICYIDFEHDSDNHKTLIEAASVMWENMMSAWTFVTLWPDGRTGWLSPDGTRRATVDPDGYIHLEKQ